MVLPLPPGVLSVPPPPSAILPLPYGSPLVAPPIPMPPGPPGWDTVLPSQPRLPFPPPLGMHEDLPPVMLSSSTHQLSTQPTATTVAHAPINMATITTCTTDTPLALLATLVRSATQQPEMIPTVMACAAGNPSNSRPSTSELQAIARQWPRSSMLAPRPIRPRPSIVRAADHAPITHSSPSSNSVSGVLGKYLVLDTNPTPSSATRTEAPAPAATIGRTVTPIISPARTTSTVSRTSAPSCRNEPTLTMTGWSYTYGGRARGRLSSSPRSPRPGGIQRTPRLEYLTPGAAARFHDRPSSPPSPIMAPECQTPSPITPPAGDVFMGHPNDDMGEYQFTMLPHCIIRYS